MKKLLFLLFLPFALNAQVEKLNPSPTRFGLYLAPWNAILRNPRIQIGGRLINDKRTINLDLAYGPRWMYYLDLGQQNTYAFYGIRPSIQWHLRKDGLSPWKSTCAGIELWYDFTKVSAGEPRAELGDNIYDFLIQERQRIAIVFQYGFTEVYTSNISLELLIGLGYGIRFLSYETGNLIGTTRDEGSFWAFGRSFPTLPRTGIGLLTFTARVGFVFPSKNSRWQQL